MATNISGPIRTNRKEVCDLQSFESIVEQKSEQLLLKAFHFGASDIHLVPDHERYTIYFRKFSRLIPAGELPLLLAERIVTYFKFLSSLDISEKRKPQSGSFQKDLNDKNFSFRVSTLPSIFSRESLVIRLLLQQSAAPLSILSYDLNDADILLNLVQEKQGILFLTGATGSGKTTTLYSLIHYCSNSLQRHVISLEDPVENKQSNLLQIQVNERAGVTYSVGLKAILRHSPDIIMIGEIRDRETAHIAIEAALTGHLVLSTIHAKDSVGCLYRLLDLGISIEDIRQTVIGIVAQTLISTTFEGDERRALFEILSHKRLSEAIEAIRLGEIYTLPREFTLKHKGEAVLESYRYAK